MSYCPHCGEKVIGKRELCAYCGEDLKSRSIQTCYHDVDDEFELTDLIQSNYTTEGNYICSHCGALNPLHHQYCKQCGENLYPDETIICPKGKKVIHKNVDLAWCIITGFLGGHKFYEGKPWMGALYACTFGLGGIGVLIDLIAIASNPYHYYPKK